MMCVFLVGLLTGIFCAALWNGLQTYGERILLETRAIQAAQAAAKDAAAAQAEKDKVVSGTGAELAKPAAEVANGIIQG